MIDQASIILRLKRTRKLVILAAVIFSALGLGLAIGQDMGWGTGKVAIAVMPVFGIFLGIAIGVTISVRRLEAKT